MICEILTPNKMKTLKLTLTCILTMAVLISINLNLISSSISNSLESNAKKSPPLFQLIKSQKSRIKDLGSNIIITKNPIGRKKAEAIERVKTMIAAQLPDYISGGKPQRNLIVSTWRSGSSFLGEMIAVHPGTIFFYEPFMYLESRRIRATENVTKALEMIDALSECNFHYTAWLRNNGIHVNTMISWTPGIKTICTDIPGSCSDPEFIHNVCKLFPIKLMKFVRLQLRDIEPLLQDDRYDTKVVYLFRDPRGTIKSRNVSSYWCYQHADCAAAETLCTDLVDDFRAAQNLKELFPNRLNVLRYEDLSMNVSAIMENIMSFFNLENHPALQKFAKSHTSEDRGLELGTFRVSNQTAFKWMDFFKSRPAMLENIQYVCKDAMALLGYKFVNINLLEKNATTNRYDLAVSPL